LAAGDSQARRELLSRLQARSPSAAAATAPPVEYDEEVTIFPRAVWSSEAYFAAGSLTLGLIVLASMLFFRASVHQPPPPPPPATAARLNDSLDPNLIARDLVVLKRRYVSRRTLRTEVNHPGPESRIFNYFLARLEPWDDCAGLAQLEIRSEAPAQGFVAEGLCLDEDGRVLSEKLELIVKWTQRTAVAGFSGDSETAEVEMFPPLK
jgi:hypothetical protein